VNQALRKTEFIQPIPLPEAHQSGGKTLFEALAARKLTREFASRALSLQLLADLL
jgi:hypothetical protein